MFSSLLLVTTLAGDPLHDWRLTPSQLADGVFAPLAGELALTAPGTPRFAGEGASAALVFPGDTPGLTTGARIAGGELPSEELSLEAWVAVDRPQDWGGFLCAIEDNGSYERGWLLGVRRNRFCFALASAGAQTLTYLEAPAAFAPGRWYHLLGTYDGEVQRLYIDGSLASESSTQSGAVIYHEDHQLALGAYLDQNEDYRLAGALHRAAIWDEALTAREVQRRFRSTALELPGPEGGSLSGWEPPPPAGLAELQPRINAAIEAGVERLLHTQLRDGSWGYSIGAYRNGATALALYALLECGLRAEHPAVVAGLGFLAQSDPTKTYSAGCQLLALGATGDEQHAEWAERIVELLLDWESSAQPGSWGYPGGAVDISNTQFAALGFWGASKLRVSVPRDAWQRMVEKTVEDHQPNVVEVPWVGPDATRSGDRRIAGYTYFAGGHTYPESGSMTTAGLCVLALAERVAGTRLGARFLRLSERSKPLALGWLETHYTVSTNPGYPSTVYYYLYGLERVGALLELEHFAGQPWYRDGAEWLVGQQQPDGSWARHDQTAFALLFLTRATAPTSGAQISRTGGVWTSEVGEVRLRATGGEHVTVWISGFADSLRAAHEHEDQRRSGLRVRAVRWLADGVEFARVEGDPNQPWSAQRFPARHGFDRPGEHTLQAMVELVPAGDVANSSAAGEMVASPALTILAEASPEAWMLANNELALPLSRTLAEASASSASDTAGLALDGLQATAWVCAVDDPAPSLRLRLERPLRTRAILISPADATLETRGWHDRVVRLALYVNGEREAIELVAPEDPLEPIRYEFERPPRLRELRLRVLEREPGGRRAGLVGFAEVAFLTER